MISLTFFSTAVQDLTVGQLTQLLATCRSWNRKFDLTGMMLYAGGHFVQTIEGPDEDVLAMYERIRHDPRHRDVFESLREPIAVRAFPDWSMGFDLVLDRQLDSVPGFTDYLQADGRGGQVGGRAGVFHRVFRDNMR